MTTAVVMLSTEGVSTYMQETIHNSILKVSKFQVMHLRKPFRNTLVLVCSLIILPTNTSAFYTAVVYQWWGR